MADLKISGLWKRYGTTEVLKDIDLEVADGELVVFVGPRAAASRRCSG
jgi:ABC-type sugar transport system ATPase subunit